MNRLRAAFDRPGTRLVIYLTAGIPSVEESADLVVRAAEAGADVIELGMPFSDPTADGPVIRAAMHEALAAGVHIPEVLRIVKLARDRGCEAALLLFGYYNPVFTRGIERFCTEAAQAGADGLLIVDLPMDEAEELALFARPAGLEIIPLLAPTSGPERMQKAAALDPAFVYYVSMTGVTGSRLTDTGDIAARVAHIKQAVGRPVAVGFGIQTPEDARRVAGYADAVVVGTAIVRAGTDCIPLVTSLRAAIC